MTALTIPPLTVPAGAHTFGPFAVTGGWSHFDATFDIASLVSMNTLVEFSDDGGVSWRVMVQETGLTPSISPLTGLPVPYHLVADWSPPLSAGLIRFSLDNAASFASTGGALTVT